MYNGAVGISCRFAVSFSYPLRSFADDPVWREAYSVAVENNQVDELVISTSMALR
jgi:hypothetical protein